MKQGRLGKSGSEKRFLFKKYRDWSCIYQKKKWTMNETFILYKYEVCSKSIKTEILFTKKDMNNEWNVHFLSNTRYVQKVSRQKLYLPRKKWTMNNTFIFFQIRGVFKKYQDRNSIYQERNEQWMKRSFSKQSLSHSTHIFQRVFYWSKHLCNTSFDIE